MVLWSDIADCLWVLRDFGPCDEGQDGRPEGGRNHQWPVEPAGRKALMTGASVSVFTRGHLDTEVGEIRSGRLPSSV